jgi:hypothetical protein
VSGRGSADGGVYIDTLGEITNNPTVPGPAEFGGVAYLSLPYPLFSVGHSWSLSWSRSSSGLVWCMVDYCERRYT